MEKKMKEKERRGVVAARFTSWESLFAVFPAASSACLLFSSWAGKKTSFLVLAFMIIFTFASSAPQ